MKYWKNVCSSSGALFGIKDQMDILFEKDPNFNFKFTLFS